MKKILALFLLILFASIALPIRGADSFNNNIVEEEIVAKKKLVTNGYETFHFSQEFLSSSLVPIPHCQYVVAALANPFLAVPGQPPNDMM